MSRTDQRMPFTGLPPILGILLALAMGLTAAAPAQSGNEPGDQRPGQSQTSTTQEGSAAAPLDAAVLKAPDFTLKDLKGRTVHLFELLQKGPVYLDFWTSWCGPCKREMPELDRIHKTYRDRGFAVVAIAQDDTRTVAKVKPYVDSNKFQFIAATDTDKSVGNAYNVRQYPTSFLIRKDGTVAYFAQAYLPGDEKKVEGLVRGLLGLGTGEQSPGATK